MCAPNHALTHEYNYACFWIYLYISSFNFLFEYIIPFYSILFIRNECQIFACVESSFSLTTSEVIQLKCISSIFCKYIADKWRIVSVLYLDAHFSSIQFVKKSIYERNTQKLFASNGQYPLDVWIQTRGFIQITAYDWIIKHETAWEWPSLYEIWMILHEYLDIFDSESNIWWRFKNVFYVRIFWICVNNCIDKYP